MSQPQLTAPQVALARRTLRLLFAASVVIAPGCITQQPQQPAHPRPADARPYENYGPQPTQRVVYIVDTTPVRPPLWSTTSYELRRAIHNAATRCNRGRR